jgi:hypothetical protein
MNRGLALAWSWRLPYWWRVSPGLAGGILYLVLPLLFFLPLEALPIFEDRLRGIALLLWFFAVAFALGVAAKRGPREEDSVWLFQKGVPLWEASVEDWLLDLGLAAAAAAWWASVGTLALLGSGRAPWSLWLSLLVLGLVTAVLAQTLVLVLSASGVPRAVDLTVLTILLAMVAPALTFQAPEGLQTAVSWALPPFQVAWTLAGALRSGLLNAGAAALLQILVFTGCVLGLGLWRISRWRPNG